MVLVGNKYLYSNIPQLSTICASCWALAVAHRAITGPSSSLRVQAYQTELQHNSPYLHTLCCLSNGVIFHRRLLEAQEDCQKLKRLAASARKRVASEVDG